MNYELAKQLKDAGFPYDWDHFELIDDDDTSNYPTLSELIEACECKSFSLICNEALIETARWEACDAAAWELADKQQYGATPEEAVTRLWLALRKEQKESPQ